MAVSGSVRWGNALLTMVLGLPASFGLGVLAWVAFHRLVGPPVGGEALQGVAMAAFLMGGPLGLIAGSAVFGAVGYWLAARSRFVALGLLDLVLAAGSLWVLLEL